MAAYILLFVAFQACVLVSEAIPDENLVVQTEAGKIRGWSAELNGMAYRFFAGVPYAEPPVGDLRFMSPVKKMSWNKFVILNTTSYGPSCPQNADTVSDILPDFLAHLSDSPFEISEDCLSLNVYTPYPANESNLAVMVWLHGGSYRQGKSSVYDPSPLAVKGGIIVVTINYRLGPFGFLFTGDKNAPGNMGLMDQQLALKWVKDNIQAFGGDPSRVTLAGQAGLHGSASLHLFANGSRSLFQRVVAHSGIYRPRDLTTPQRASWHAELFADNANCPIDAYSCLREKSTEEIMSSSNLQSQDKDFSSFLWQPVFTPDFFIEEPSDSEKYNLLSSVNSGDGTVTLEQLKDTSPDAMPEISSQLTEKEWDNWFFVYSNDPVLANIVISREYLKRDFESEQDEKVARMVAFVDSQSDNRYKSYGASAIHAIKSSLKSTHVMVFNHQSSNDMRFRPELKLAPHGSELPYIFGMPFDEVNDLGGRFSDDERELSYQLMRLWSNFVKTGNPNGDMVDMNPLGDDLVWPEFNSEEKHLKIELKEAEVGNEYRKDGVYIWDEYIPSLRCRDMPPPPHNECKTPVIGQGLGLSLNNDQAESMIKALIFAGIAVVCVAVFILGIACAYRARVNTMSKFYSGMERESGKNDYSEVGENAAMPAEIEVEVSSDPHQPGTTHEDLSPPSPSYLYDVRGQEIKNQYTSTETKVDKHVGTSPPYIYANITFTPDINEPNYDHEEEEKEEEEEEEEKEDGEMEDDVPPPQFDGENYVTDDEDLPPPPSLEGESEDGYHGDEPVETPPDSED